MSNGLIFHPRQASRIYRETAALSISFNGRCANRTALINPSGTCCPTRYRSPEYRKGLLGLLDLGCAVQRAGSRRSPPVFKGGTSLSKAFSLISRFSEYIDITVFRDDQGQKADVAELDALSGKKRRARKSEEEWSASSWVRVILLLGLCVLFF